MPKPWSELESESVVQTPILALSRRRRVSPRTAGEHDFWVLEMPHFVNVVALTPERELVMVRQYRHGVEQVTLEIPGGLVDPEDPSPQAAGRRELREETGFQAREWAELGYVHPNPAIQTNRCYTILARDAYLEGEIDPDPGEDLVVELVPVQAIPRFVAEGRIRHALAITGLAFAWGLGELT